MVVTRLRLVLLGALVACATAALTLVTLGSRSPELVLQLQPLSPDSQITVYVGGAVASPGLYNLPVHTRVAEAVEQAYPLDEADLAAVPMAATMHDGQQVVVPRRAAGATPAAARQASQPARPSAPINVNTASEAELETLPGVGPVLAQRMIEYRNAHGPYKTLQELTAVRGVSDRMLQDWRDLVSVGP